MAYEWDENKNRANIHKHRINFVQARGIFTGDVVVRVDFRRDYGETREAAIGVVDGLVLYVVYTWRGAVSLSTRRGESRQIIYTWPGESRRIISARRANRSERRAYREVFPG